MSRKNALNKKEKPQKTVYLLALLVVGALCSGYLLMFAARSVHQSHYPEQTAQWANNGSWALLGMYGTETNLEELGYSSRVQEASDHWVPSDPFLLENRSTRILITGYLNYRVMGLVHKIVGNMNWTWFVLRAMFSFLWVLLIYHLALRIGLPEPAALFAAVFATCQGHLFTFVWINNIHWWGGVKELVFQNAWTMLSYGRTELLRMPRPAATYPALFLAALLNVRTAEKLDTRSAVISGVWGGLLAYVRMDIWSSYLAATFIFAAVSSYHKKKIIWPLVCSAVLSLIVSIPWLSVYLGAHNEAMVRAGLIFNRDFNFIALIYLAAFAASVYRFREPMHLFSASILASVFLANNIQLITGYSFFPFLWRTFGNIFFLLILLSIIPRKWLQKEVLWKAGMIGVLSLTTVQSISYGAIHYPFYGMQREQEGALKWISRNVEKDKVVLALNPEVTFLLASHTGAKTFIASGSTPLSDHPSIENVRRLMIGLKLLGIDRNRFLKETVYEPPVAEVRRFWKRGEVEKDNFVGAYFLFNNSKDLDEHLAIIDAETDVPMPQLDYVWIGAFERQYLPAEFPEGTDLKEVYSNPRVALYAKGPLPLQLK